MDYFIYGTQLRSVFVGLSARLKCFPVFGRVEIGTRAKRLYGAQFVKPFTTGICRYVLFIQETVKEDHGAMRFIGGC